MIKIIQIWQEEKQHKLNTNKRTDKQTNKKKVELSWENLELLPNSYGFHIKISFHLPFLGFFFVQLFVICCYCFHTNLTILPHLVVRLECFNSFNRNLQNFISETTFKYRASSVWECWRCCLWCLFSLTTMTHIL